MIVLLLHVCVYTRVCFNNTRLCVFVFVCFVLYIHALLLASCAVCNTHSDQSTWVPKLPPGVTAETKNLQLQMLIARCCNEDPSKRPTMTTVVKRLQEIQEDPSQESSKAPKRKERG